MAIQIHTRRVDGWCEECQGPGSPPAEHLDVDENGKTWVGTTGSGSWGTGILAADESLSEEIARLHLEIRGLNGQLEGSARAMAGLRDRVAKLQQENADLKKAAKVTVR